MKNQTIRERYQALNALAQRVLPSATAITKVSALLDTRFRAPYEATETARKMVIAQYPLPADYEGENVPMAIAEQRQLAIDAMLEQSTPVKKIPDRLRLTSADLPKVLKREGGEGNAESLAQIIVMLGSLYVRSGEEVFQDDSQGEEPDELAPAPIDAFAPAADATE